MPAEQANDWRWFIKRWDQARIRLVHERVRSSWGATFKDIATNLLNRIRNGEHEALSKLRAWVDKRRLEVEGDPMFGYYDPPWIPPFMRRNEVMLHVDGTQP